MDIDEKYLSLLNFAEIFIEDFWTIVVVVLVECTTPGTLSVFEVDFGGKLLWNCLLRL